MSDSYKHVCIKPGCGAQYESSDPDPYYCDVCAKQAQAIAAEVNKKVASRPSKGKSTIKILEEGGTVPGPHGSRLFMRGVRHGN